MTLSVKEQHRRLNADIKKLDRQLRWFEKRAKVIFEHNKSIDKYNQKGWQIQSEKEGQKDNFR